MHFKHIRIKHRGYLDFIRKQKCLVCNQPAEPHHAWATGGGNKQNDFCAIPLCRQCHTNAHKGEKTWQEKTGLYYESEIMKLMAKFIETQTL